MMIECAFCKTANTSTAQTCSKCKKSLLPGRTLKERWNEATTGVFVIGAAAILGLISYGLLQIELPGILACLQVFVYMATAGLAIFAFIGFWGFLGSALNPFTSKKERYFLRAKRHFLVDKERALSDINEAIYQDPENINYLSYRSKLYEESGRLGEALADQEKILKWHKAHKTNKPIFHEHMSIAFSETHINRLKEKLASREKITEKQNDTTEEEQPPDKQDKPKQIWRDGRFYDNEDESNEVKSE
jgi:hypothetical protein